MSVPLPPSDGAAAGAAILDLARSRGHVPRLVGLGEPLHGPQEFGRLASGVFRHLVEHAGFRTIALESSAWAGRVADAWVCGGPGDLDDVASRGLTHDFGAFPANRELLRWARDHNRDRPPSEQVHVTGFDGPLEMMSADSPRAALAHLHDFLAGHGLAPVGWETLDALLADDHPWTDERVAMDPSLSVGATDRARDLRVLADDLSRALTCAAPALVRAAGRAAVDDAALAARCATGLLAYHASMADTGDGARRWSRNSGLRDVMMADNLTALAARGPTLAFGHVAHLRTGPARMMLGPMDVRWQAAGAHLLGPDYLVVGIGIGHLDGVGEPAPDTLEGRLCRLPAGNHLLPTHALPRGCPLRSSQNPAYFPLDDAALDELDAVLFVRDVPAG